MTDSVRLPWVTDDVATAEQRELRQEVEHTRSSSPRARPLVDGEGRVGGPFNAMLTAPNVGRPLQDLGQALRFRGTLTERERELAILLVAAEAKSEYEWATHSAVGRSVGLNPSQLRAIQDGQVPSDLCSRELAVVAFVGAVARSGDASPDQYAQAEQDLSSAQLVELVVLVGYYQLLATLLRVFRVPASLGDATIVDQQAD